VVSMESQVWIPLKNMILVQKFGLLWQAWPRIDRLLVRIMSVLVFLLTIRITFNKWLEAFLERFCVEINHLSFLKKVSKNVNIDRISYCHLIMSHYLNENPLFKVVDSNINHTLGVCQLFGKIYALGGHNGLSIFESVECYDTNTGTWEECKPMLSKRCRLGVAALSGKVSI